MTFSEYFLEATFVICENQGIKYYIGSDTFFFS